MAWNVDYPQARPALRAQLAQYALNESMDPARFRRVTGHEAADEAAVREWFAQIYRELYGNRPELDRLNRRS